MNSIIIRLKPKVLKEKIKLGQGPVGVRGKDGQLRETQIPNLVYSDFSSFFSLSPHGLHWPSYYHARMKFFNSNECPEEIDPEEPEDTCSHGNLLGECDICDEDEDVIEENPDEIEEQNSASERRNTMPINLNYEKLHRLTKNI